MSDDDAFAVAIHVLWQVQGLLERGESSAGEDSGRKIVNRTLHNLREVVSDRLPRNGRHLRASFHVVDEAGEKNVSRLKFHGALKNSGLREKPIEQLAMHVRRNNRVQSYFRELSSMHSTGNDYLFNKQEQSTFPVTMKQTVHMTPVELLI